MGDAAAGSTGAFATRLTGPLGRFWRIIVGSDKLGFFGYHWISQNTYALHFHFHGVSGQNGAYARGRTRGDDIAFFQGELFGYVGNQNRNGKDHLPGVSRLF